MKTITQLGEVRADSSILVLYKRGKHGTTLNACPKNLFSEDLLSRSNEYAYNHSVTNIVNGVLFTYSAAYFLDEEAVKHPVVQKYAKKYEGTEDRKYMETLTDLWKKAEVVLGAELFSGITVVHYEKVLRASEADAHYFIVTAYKTGPLNQQEELRLLQIVNYMEDGSYDVVYREMDPDVIAVTAILMKEMARCKELEKEKGSSDRDCLPKSVKDLHDMPVAGRA